MGSKDVTTRRLEECNDVFADIMNVLVFDGERQIHEDDLVDIDTKTEFLADDKGFRTQERDVAKFWKSHNVKLALFGLENQAAPDFQMPLRLYSYNGASYKAQIIPDRPKGKANDVHQNIHAEDEHLKQPFYPVLTLVLYFGFDRWNTAKSLYEAIQIPKAFRRFIPDLPINLIEVAWLEDAVIDKFQSDFQVVARFFKQYRIHGNAYLEMQDPKLLKRIEHVLETMRMISAYTGDPEYEAYGIRQSHNKEVTMIAALKEYREDLKKEGRKQGRKEGRKEGRKDTAAVFMQLFNAGRADDVQRAVREPEYLDKLMAEFGYSDDDNKDDAHQS